MAISDSKKERTITVREDSFSEEYKAKIFQLWYNTRKPDPRVLHRKIDEPDPKTGFIPSQYVLRTWVDRDFKTMAMGLDEEVALGLQKQWVTDKLEVMEVQANLAKDLYEMGMKYLKEHGLGNSRTALSAVIEGMKIERENKGAPMIMGSISKMDDSRLLDVFEELAKESELISVEAHDDSSETLSNM